MGRPRKYSPEVRERAVHSVTTAVVTMVPRSTEQRVVVSAVHDLKPSTHGLQRPLAPDLLSEIYGLDLPPLGNTRI